MTMKMMTMMIVSTMDMMRRAQFLINIQEGICCRLNLISGQNDLT